jgi:TIR domain
VQGREVFISYRSLDNEAPPGCKRERGFVNYLITQVKYDLRQLGVPDTILWQDRAKIEKGDIWSEAIFNALGKAELFIAVLSRNYITSPWCHQELSTMLSRIKMLGESAGKRRIFRVDKHNVPEHEIPDTLRTIQSVQFYSKDDDRVDEYFWRGKVRRTKDYETAIRELAEAISKRLDELGVPLQPPPSQPSLGDYNALPSNGRVVFVAKPAKDMDEAYRTLVCELRGMGYRVTPDSEKDLGKLGEEVRSSVNSALAEAEASIHLLGKRTGGRPCGLDEDLVPMQLAAAADEAKKKPDFVRMIWAPTVLLGTSEAEITPRDPLSIVNQFGERLPTDQIYGDTASHFNEYVLQRLERLSRNDGNPAQTSVNISAETRDISDHAMTRVQAVGMERKIIYVRCGAGGRTREFALTIAKELKRVGFDPILVPLARVEQKHFGEGRHIITCWGSQSQEKILNELETIHSWKTAKPTGGKLILLLTSPSTKAKAEALDLEIPYVDHIVDARECDHALIGEKLVSALG